MTLVLVPISTLPSASPLSGSELLAAVQGGETVKVSISDIFSIMGSSPVSASYSANTTQTTYSSTAGDVVWNNASQSSATQLFFAFTDKSGNAMGDFLDNNQVGDTLYLVGSDVGKYQEWLITAKHTSVDHQTFTVTLIFSNHDFASGENVNIVFQKSSSSGTVTSVSGVAANGFTWSIANPTTTPALTIDLQYADATHDGKLKQADWVTFNGKQSPATTLAGYGITDAYTKTASDARYAQLSGGAGAVFTGTVTLSADAVSSLQPVTLQQLQSQVAGLWDDRGNFTPSGSYPSSGGSGTAGAILKGDIWTITGLGSGVSGTMGTKTVYDGYTVRALSDSPGSTNSLWATAENGVGYIPLSNTLNSANIFVGNASNNAIGVAVTGDITISNTGVTAIGSGKVVNSMIANSTIDLTAKVTGLLPDSNIASATNWNAAYTNRITSFTTTGSSGAATLASNALNIPTYTLAGLGGFANPMTTSGDIIYGGTSGVPTRLAKSTDGFVLTLSSGSPVWSAITPSQWTTIGSDIYYAAGNVMIGNATAPLTKLHVVETSTATLRGALFGQYSNDVLSSKVVTRKARGTYASPTTIVVGDVLSNWTTAAYDGTTFLDAASIRTASVGTIGTNRTPTKMEFLTMTDITTGVLTVALTLDQLQNATFAGTISVSALGSSLVGITNLAIRDTSAAFDVTIAAVSSTALTAGRTLTYDLVNAARTIKLGGNLTLAGNLVTTGAFNLTIAVPQTTTYTLPNTANETLAGLNTAQTFIGQQVIRPATGSNFKFSSGSLAHLNDALTVVAPLTISAGAITLSSSSIDSQVSLSTASATIGFGFRLSGAFTQTTGTGNVNGFSVIGTVNQSGGSGDFNFFNALPGTISSVLAKLVMYRSNLSATVTGGGTAWSNYHEGTAPNWFAGNMQMNAAIASQGKQVHTSGATVTFSNGLRALYVNPTSTIAALTITMPSAPLDGQEILIHFGGTLTSGSVVTVLTLSGNSGQTILAGTAITTANAGDGIILKYESSTSLWRIH